MKRVILTLLCFSLTTFAQDENDFCENGFKQSPIDINHVEQAKMPELVFKYREGKFHFSNQLPTNLFAYAQDNMTLEIEGIPYVLRNIHVHTPGEHTLAGKPYPMEIHFVHESFEGYEYTVAQWVRVGRSNPALTSLLNNFTLGKNKPPKTYLDFGLDPNGLLAPFRNYFRYEGSETYSPCAQNVSWFVMKNTLEVGKDQIAALHQLLGDNNRPVQKLNERVITESLP